MINHIRCFFKEWVLLSNNICVGSRGIVYHIKLIIKQQHVSMIFIQK